jgi:hypothetical protein
VAALDSTAAELDPAAVGLESMVAEIDPVALVSSMS